LPFTARHVYYPNEGDTPDVPRDLTTLANRVDAEFVQMTGAAFAAAAPDANLVGRRIRITASGGGHTAGQVYLDIGTAFILDSADLSTVQPLDGTLTALAAIVTAADKLIYATGADAFSTTTLSGFIRTLLDDPDAATALATLGAQASDADLIALAALPSAADKMPYSTGAQAWALTTITAAARTILARADGVHYDDVAKDANGLAAGSFHAYRAATQGPAASGYEVVWNAEAIDVSGWHNPATGRFTPQVAGYYDLKWLTTHLAVTAGKYLQSNLYKNGALHRAGPLAIQDAAGNPLRSGASAVVKANGTTDYFSVFVFTDDAAGIAVMGGTGREDLSHFCGHLIGRST
jgi:hypothetical protein